jgi:hypothetical protein
MKNKPPAEMSVVIFSQKLSNKDYEDMATIPLDWISYKQRNPAARQRFR